jgi:hypothetical protein
MLLEFEEIDHISGWQGLNLAQDFRVGPRTSEDFIMG